MTTSKEKAKCVCSGMLRVNHPLLLSDNSEKNLKETPSKSCIMRWVKNFLETGNVMGLPQSGRSSESKETIDNVQAAFQCSPQ